MKVQSFEELTIWQEAREIAKLVFAFTRSKEFDKDYRFRNQITSSSGSIMDNIAEEFERKGNKEFMQFLSIAKGSLAETRSQCFRALDYGYFDSNQTEKLLRALDLLSLRMGKLISYLKTSQFKGSKLK
jgi:four helix bundle protein